MSTKPPCASRDRSTFPRHAGSGAAVSHHVPPRTSGAALRASPLPSPVCPGGGVPVVLPFAKRAIGSARETLRCLATWTKRAALTPEDGKELDQGAKSTCLPFSHVWCLPVRAAHVPAQRAVRADERAHAAAAARREPQACSGARSPWGLLHLKIFLAPMYKDGPISRILQTGLHGCGCDSRYRPFFCCSLGFLPRQTTFVQAKAPTTTPK